MFQCKEFCLNEKFTKINFNGLVQGNIKRSVFFFFSFLINFFEGEPYFQREFFLKGALFLKVARGWFLFGRTETNSNDVKWFKFTKKVFFFYVVLKLN